MNNFVADARSYFARDESLEKLRANKIKAARTNFRDYCNLINPAFFKPSRKYQDDLCGVMQAIYEKRLINHDTGKPYDILIINMPPGFGKSFTNMNFAAWVFGQNAHNQVISVSYNQTLSAEFARGVRGMIMDEPIVGDSNFYCVNSVFPHLKIKKGDGAVEKWALEGRGVYRSYLATSFDGSITGMRGNIVIIDDPIKNLYEAFNDRVKDSHWKFFTGTLPSRVLPGGIQIIIQTRWATDDLAGRIIDDAEYSKRCYVVEMRALNVDGADGKSLCEDLYPTEDLQAKRRGMLPEIWSANFQQTPINLKGQLYADFKTYDKLPADAFGRSLFTQVRNYTDTADTGLDYLCSINYGVYQNEAYILNVLYTSAPMEHTEPAVASMLNKDGVNVADIESNSGGRGFARAVERILYEKHHSNRTRIKPFHQSKNKVSRILSNATWVMDHIYFPANWKDKWPEYYKAMVLYQREGTNPHDDAPDATTGIAEKMGRGSIFSFL